MTDDFDEDEDDLIDEGTDEDWLVGDNPDEMTPREVKKAKLQALLPTLKKLAAKLPDMSRDDKVEALLMIEAAEKMGCELSLAKFLRCAWPYLDTSEYKHNWHIDSIANYAEGFLTGERRRLIVNQPPRTCKSLLLTVAFPIWIWIQSEKGPLSGPHVKFMTASYAQSLSFEHSNLARKLISSPWFQKHWGDRFKLREDRNAIGYFENDRGGSRFSTSVGAGLTGRGADCVKEGTLISTPDGDKRVESLRVGDTILGFDSLRGEVVSSKVLATATREDRNWYELRTDEGHSLECTGKHPVFVQGRGYVPAEKISRGDRVVLYRGALDTGKSSLRLLRGKISEANVRPSKDAEEGSFGCVLRKEMLRRPPCGKEQGILHSLWGAENAFFLVLFGRMQSRKEGRRPGATGQGARKNLCFLRETILENEIVKVLLSGLRRQSTFVTDEWQRKFKFQGTRVLFKSIQKDVALYKTAGQTNLRGLRSETQVQLDTTKRSKNAPAVQSSHSPHRREHPQQQAGEFNNVVRELPHNASQRRFGTIASARKHSGGTNKFYDIQVERVSNFFANGILVHNCIIIDDPSDSQQVSSEAERTAVINWYTQALSTRLNDPKTGAMLLVMQRQNSMDLTGFILESEPEMWDHVCFRMRYESNPYLDYDPRSEEGELLWPDRVPELEVIKLEKTLGSHGAAGQLQQRPSVKGGEIIKSSDWQLFPPEGQEEDWKRDGKICWPPVEFVVASLDGAFSEKTSADPSALTVWGIWYDKTNSPKIICMHAWQQQLSFNPLVIRVGNTCRKFKVDVLLIEAKASGISVAQEIRRVYGASEWTTHLINPKGDKVSRALAVQGLFEEALVFAPNRVWAQMLIDQCAEFPAGKHDDLVDTTSQALTWLRVQGLIRRRDERARDVFDSLPKSGDFAGEALYDV